jgi:asparagine synthase (glutamine-hydrolysing)
MCGISGVWQYPAVSQPDSSRLEASGRLMSHRGPDWQAVYADTGVGLVHTRLSLLDLNERSNQPFSDPTEQHVLVFNGEIYNFRELRDRLVSRGSEFVTTSDTEVLLQCLIHLGLDETLAQLEGMFAFAWYDRAAQRLTLARDRFGMKPLFYHDHAGTLYFASEVRVLRPWLAMSPDHFSIAAWLQKGKPPTQGFTFYSGVRALSPGMVLSVGRNDPPASRRYFDLLQFYEPEYAASLRRMPIGRLVDQVDELLNQSVAMQLAADVPVGAFRSGGVDSSVVMAMAARQHGKLAIFHANVGGRYSEFAAAAELADHLKLDLLSVDVEDSDFLDLLPRATQHFGHPIAYREESIPLLSVSHLVRDHGIRAVISGEGSDEIFLGYNWRIPSRTAALEKLIPNRRRVRNIVKRIVFGRYAELNSTRPQMNLALGLLSRFEVEIENTARQLAGSRRELSSLDTLAFHLRTLLHRNDSMGMSASVECRFPILDSELVRLAVNLPYRSKVRRSWRLRDWRHPFLQNKWILREVASRYMPSSLSLRPKAGFPTNAFRRMEIPPKYLAGCSAADILELSQREIAFLAEHGDQRLLARLLHLSVWCDVCLNDQDPHEVAGQLRQQIATAPDRWT